MKMFGTPKEIFFSSKARLNFEVYGQGDKITPEAREKKAPFSPVQFLCGQKKAYRKEISK